MMRVDRRCSMGQPERSSFSTVVALTPSNIESSSCSGS
jgi:hypothetical protein